MTKTKINYDTVIICDLIRKEDNGKAILIGVYNQDIILEKLPGRILLSSYISGTIESHEQDIKLEFRIRFDKDTIAKGETLIPKTDDLGTFVIVMQNLWVKIEETGQLSFDIRSAKSKWKTLKNLDVKLRK